MITLHKLPLPTAAQGHLRPVQLQRDLPEVAELIELCFKESLDLDGRSYLRQLRHSAREHEMYHWISSAAELLHGMPVSGLVWEEEGRIVGNLSLISMPHWHKRITLIANVAVHPDFRGQGIARALTTTALAYTRQKKIDAVWLLVRDDNPPAMHIYRSLGFQERSRRTSWACQGKQPAVLKPADPLSEGYSVVKRPPSHWEQQALWLKRLYPEDLRWQLPMRWGLFQPGFWGEVYRFFRFEYPTHWSLLKSKRLHAVLTSIADGSQPNTFWLAAPPEAQLDREAVRTLLIYGLQQRVSDRSLSLNLPAGYAEEAVQDAGFHLQHTLIWMQILF